MQKRSCLTYCKRQAWPLLAGCMLTLSACSTDDVLSDHGDVSLSKTPIALTVGIHGEGGALTRSGRATRSVTTTDDNSLARAFGRGTSLYMVMKSEDGGAYTPPASAGSPKYTRTMGHAQTQKDVNSSKVEFGANYVRYYEDSYSRDSKVSIFAACVPGHYLSGSYTGSTGTANATAISINSSTVYNDGAWSTSAEATTIAWPLRNASVATQDEAFISSQDLCFSNNVANPAGGTDNRIYFNETATSELDRGFVSQRMVFYHALTKVTFRIIKGKGFESGDFAFTKSGQNIVLTGFNTGGTLDIEEGEFKTSSPAITTNTIHSMCISSNTSSTAVNGQAYQLDCLMLPGTDLDDTDSDAIIFEIDHNEYHMSKHALLDALSGTKIYEGETYEDEALDGTAMRPGVNYVFTLTIGKQKVESLTGSVVPWETVTAANHNPTHARIVVSLLKNGVLQTGADATFDLYRKADVADDIPADENAYASFDWTTGYAPTDNPTINKAKLTEGTSGTYAASNADADLKDNPGDPDTWTPWYWPNNKTFYHFRTVLPKNTAVTENPTKGDYINLTGEPIAGSSEYTGVCWGAPFKHIDLTDPQQRVTYSLQYGFDNTQDEGADPDSEANHQISKAIGATKNAIDIEMFHMMSDVTFKLTTTTGSDAVSLDGATVTLSNIYNQGLVRMGTGKVETTGTVATNPAINGTVALVSGNHQWRYAFVPQSLASVVLTIQTTDHNLYFVNLKDVVANSVGSNTIAAPSYQDNKIDYWYPNYKYTYTFKLTKSNISLITATLANWESVVAKEESISIQ